MMKVIFKTEHDGDETDELVVSSEDFDPRLSAKEIRARVQQVLNDPEVRKFIFGTEFKFQAKAVRLSRLDWLGVERLDNFR